jgi:hypothetical protein
MAVLGFLSFPRTRSLGLGMSAGASVLGAAAVGFLLVLALGLTGMGGRASAQGIAAVAALCLVHPLYRNLAILGLSQVVVVLLVGICIYRLPQGARNLSVIILGAALAVACVLVGVLLAAVEQGGHW